MVLPVISRCAVVLQKSGFVFVVDAIADDHFVELRLFVVVIAEDVRDFAAGHAELDAFGGNKAIDLPGRLRAVDVACFDALDLELANDVRGIAFVIHQRQLFGSVCVTNESLGVVAVGVVQLHLRAEGEPGAGAVIQLYAGYREIDFAGQLGGGSGAPKHAS